MPEDRITARIEKNIHEISMILRELRLTNDVRVIFDVPHSDGEFIRRMTVGPKSSLILSLEKSNHGYFVFARTYINNSVHSPNVPVAEINLIAYSDTVDNRAWYRNCSIYIETTNGVVCDGDMEYINDVLRNEIEPDMHRLYLAGLD
ncbi:MAG: hypothetical protein WDA29_10575 [Flavobacteriaceae bacterium]